MDNSDTIHRLADTTYRNIDELTGNLKKLLSVTKSLARAMEDIIPISEEFTTIVDSVGSKAANLPGGVRNLGVCLKEMATANRKIGAAFTDWTTSLNTDLVVPLEDKLDRETPDLMKSWKNYKSETSKKETVVEKTSKNVKALRKKKSTMENIEKETQLCQILEDQQRDLHSTRVEGLRKALMEQQKLYSFFIFHLCGVHHSNIQYASTAYQSLSMKVNDWTAVTSNSAELPQESLVLLKNPHSPDAYKIPGQDQSQFNFQLGRVNGLNPLEEVDTDTGRIRAGSIHNMLQQQDQGRPHPVTAADVRSIKAESQPTGGQLKRRTSCRVKAIHSFVPNEQGRLGLKAGDLIDAIGEEKDGWMYGTHSQTKESGWFPSQYVDKVWAPTPEGRKKIASSQLKSSNLAPELPERDYISGGKSPVIKRKMPNATAVTTQPPPSQLTLGVPALPTVPSTSFTPDPAISGPPPPPPPSASAPPPAAPPNPSGPPPAPPTTTPQNNPPKKQLSFAEMIKQRSSYADSD